MKIDFKKFYNFIKEWILKSLIIAIFAGIVSAAVNNPSIYHHLKFFNQKTPFVTRVFFDWNQSLGSHRCPEDYWLLR